MDAYPEFALPIYDRILPNCRSLKVNVCLDPVRQFSQGIYWSHLKGVSHLFSSTTYSSDKGAYHITISDDPVNVSQVFVEAVIIVRQRYVILLTYIIQTVDIFEKLALAYILGDALDFQVIPRVD